MTMIFGLFDRFKRKQLPEEVEEGYDEAPLMEERLGRLQSKPSVESKLHFDKTRIIYELEITNTTSDIMGGISVMIDSTRSNVVRVVDNEKKIEMLDPDQTEILKFELKPEMYCGKALIRGVIEYFDFGSKEKLVMRLPNKLLTFTSPDLKGMEMDDDSWRAFISHYSSIEVETDALELSPDKIFKELTTIIQEQNLYMLKPMVTPSLYRGVAKYIGVGRDGSKYALEFQLIGTQEQCKFLLRVWGDNPERNIGLCCSLVDKFSKHLDVDIKNYIIS